MLENAIANTCFYQSKSSAKNLRVAKHAVFYSIPTY